MASSESLASARTSDRRVPKVIYVMGAGRSGSTILGVALGNCASVFYAGELEAWLRKSGVPNFSGTKREQFWETVRESVHGDDLFGDEAWRCLEYPTAWFSLANWRRRRRLRPRYREVVGRLYRAIASTSGAAYVIDTSHYPLRARELQQLDGIDLYLLYLVRNPLGVVASFGREDTTNRSKSAAAANIYLSLTHLLSAAVFLRHRKSARLILRYEDFISEPSTTLRHVLDWVGAPQPAPNLATLSTGVPFQGNRLLRSESIAMSRDQQALAPRSSFDSYLTRVLQFPWALVLARLTPRATSTISPDCTSRHRPF